MSMDIKSGTYRLKNICDVKCSFVACTRIYQYRNRLMHYALNSTFEQIIKAVVEVMGEVAEFVEIEIMQYLPEEAQEEF